jgi:succinate-semialdehyde dehydrogenase/glutarate-semialdehyde dehydrogenase
LIPQPVVRLVTFTGSIPVGKHLAAMAGQHMKPAIMELGGHAPVIVCDDVDPIAAAATSATGKSRNAGQVCISPTRFFVLEAVYDRFTTTAFGENAKKLKIGDGLDPANQMGAARQRAASRSDGNVWCRCDAEGRADRRRR